MAAEDMMGSEGTGPEGENFAQEERQRKLIYGSVALVVGIVATLIILYAFGITSAGVEEGAEKKQKQSTTEK